MSIAADQHFSATRVHRPAAAMHWLVLTAIVAAAVLLRLILGSNMDVSWDLTLAEKVASGQRLYVDILEVNPPATVLLYLPAVLIERAIGLRADIAVELLVFFAAFASIYVSGRILSAAQLLDEVNCWRLAALTLAVLTVLPTRTFGEREHIAVMALLPFLTLVMARGAGRSVSFWWLLIGGIGAGITMVIKPHFAIPIGLAIATACVCARSLRPLFALENWIAAIVALAYGVYVVTAYPEFLSEMLPLAQATYLPVRMPPLRLYASAGVFCWLAALCILWRWKGRLLAGPLYAPLLVASAGFFLVYVIQGKGWPYHAYPMLALALLALALALGDKTRPVTAASAAPPQRFGNVFVAILPAAAIALTAAVYFNIGENTNLLIEPIRRISPHPKILLITSDLSVGHPLTRQVGGTWVSRVASLWITAGVIHRLQHETLDPGTKAKLIAYAKRDLDMLVEDIRRQQPDVIVMENEQFDWDNWAASQPDLAEELKAYRVAERIGYFFILQRVRD
jgi:hypothetical protein